MPFSDRIFLEVVDLLETPPPDLTAHHTRRQLLLLEILRVQAHDEYFLIVGAIENADVAAFRKNLRVARRDSRDRVLRPTDF